MAWTADLTNDPHNDFRLCIDVMEGDRHRATINRNSTGRLVLTVYPSENGSFDVPVEWLSGILAAAERDLTI
ncbi:MAG: hypothetical protein IPK82_17210 [Polyangiaceae bacterium]|nr:hypothetical protein [Polyangiaceae bacterium]